MQTIVMVVEQTISLGMPSSSLSGTTDELSLLDDDSLEDDEVHGPAMSSCAIWASYAACWVGNSNDNVVLPSWQTYTVVTDDELLEDDSLEEEEETLLEDDSLEEEEETLLDDEGEEAITSPAIVTPSMRKCSSSAVAMVLKRMKKVLFERPAGNANAACVDQELSMDKSCDCNVVHELLLEVQLPFIRYSTRPMS